MAQGPEEEEEELAYDYFDLFEYEGEAVLEEEPRLDLPADVPVEGREKPKAKPKTPAPPPSENEDSAKAEETQPEEQAAVRKGKGKGKGKPKKEQKISGTEFPGEGEVGLEGQPEFAEYAAIPVETKAAKRGKGKKGKKGKNKGKKEVEEVKADAAITPAVQMSFTAFLERYASERELGDDWTWESYTPSSGSLQEEEKEKQKKGKGKAKDKGKKKKEGKEKKEEEGEVKEKKGKKKKKAKKEEAKEEATEPAEDTVSTATDIMAEIRKMKELAEAQAMAEMAGDELSTLKSEKVSTATEARSEKPKKGPKKKLSKKERARLAAEQAEQARIQAELDAKQAEEEERRRLIEEREAALEKDRKETAEQQMRAEQLSNSLKIMGATENSYVAKALEDKAKHEWEQFMKRDGLPNAYDCGQLNTYLHLWEKVIEDTTIDDAAERSKEVLQLLNLLTSLIDNPVGVRQSQLKNWKWVHALLRAHQQTSLDTASYKILKDIPKNMNRLDFHTAEYRRQESSFILYMWLLIRMPPSLPNPRKPRQPRLHIDVPEMKMNVLFPEGLDCEFQVIRAFYVKYDHLSDLCATFQKPDTPEYYCLDLYKATLDEWNSKLLYKYENYQKTKKPAADEEEGEKEEVPPVDLEAGIIPTVPYRKLDPSASTYVIGEEEKMYKDIRTSLMKEVDEHVINLRKFIILGGVYSLELFYQLPQPLDLVKSEIIVSRLEVPRILNEVPFYVKYSTPPPIDPAQKRETEDLEEEVKKQEAELDRLLLFTLTLPTHIMWMDIPKVCYWDKWRQVWTTEDVHDLKHIEDKGYVTFRSTRFGSFALAAYRYSNMPFQAWEIKPEQNGTVTLQLTAAILLIEFNIKDDMVCVLQFQNATNNALREIIGVYFKLPHLIRKLQEGGVDVFPAFDAFCYVEGTCEKHWPMEKHTYFNMAQMCTCYNFAWSRWNQTAGRRSIIMQMREYKPEKIKQALHSTLLVTPLKVFFVDCTEVSPAFSDESVEGMHFYADLYYLMKGTSSMMTRNKVQNASPILVGAVFQLLVATRVLSLS